MFQKPAHISRSFTLFASLSCHANDTEISFEAQNLKLTSFHGAFTNCKKVVLRREQRRQGFVSRQSIYFEALCHRVNYGCLIL